METSIDFAPRGTTTNALPDLRNLMGCDKRVKRIGGMAKALKTEARTHRVLKLGITVMLEQESLFESLQFRKNK